MENKNEQKNQDFDIIKYLIQRRDYQAENLDNRLFQVATGALALSITFKSSITSGAPNCVWFLGVSWISFAIVILTFLAMGAFSNGVLNLTIEKPPEAVDIQRVFGPMLLKASYVLWGAFIIGIIFFTSFGIANLSSELPKENGNSEHVSPKVESPLNLETGPNRTNLATEPEVAEGDAQMGKSKNLGSRETRSGTSESLSPQASLEDTEQDGANQHPTVPELKPESYQIPKSESEVSPR